MSSEIKLFLCPVCAKVRCSETEAREICPEFEYNGKAEWVFYSDCPNCFEKSNGMSRGMLSQDKFGAVCAVNGCGFTQLYKGTNPGTPKEEKERERVIYIVYGEAGEYDEYRRWPVISYFDRRRAEEHVKNAQNKVAEFLKIPQDMLGWVAPGWNPYDPDLREKADDHIGTADYIIVSVVLKGEEK